VLLPLDVLPCGQLGPGHLDELDPAALLPAALLELLALPDAEVLGLGDADVLELGGREGAPAATPLAWKELDDRHLAPERFTLKTVPARARTADPWRDMRRHPVGLESAQRRLKALNA
jgi:hypothetical protein